MMTGTYWLDYHSMDNPQLIRYFEMHLRNVRLDAPYGLQERVLGERCVHILAQRNVVWPQKYLGTLAQAVKV